MNRKADDKKSIVQRSLPVFDSHVHFHLSDMTESGVIDGFAEGSFFICNATGPDDWQQVIDIAGKNKGIQPALGIHPGNIQQAASVSELADLLKKNNVGHIGECGLDHRHGSENYHLQNELFGYQLSLAAELGLPVSVHCVRAWGGLLVLLQKYRGRIPAVMIHAFEGSKEIMRELVKMDVYISFCLFTLRRKNSKVRECLQEVPEKHLLLDTDFPYKEKQPIGEYPGLLAELYSLAAEIRGTDTDSMMEFVYKNGKVFTSAASSR